MKIQRYSPTLDQDDSYKFASMEEDKTGDYVKYEDVLELLEELKNKSCPNCFRDEKDKYCSLTGNRV